MPKMTQSMVRTAHFCVYHCAQLSYTTSENDSINLAP